MDTLETIERRIVSAAALGNIVHAMRSQAAVYLRQAEEALSSIRSWQTRIAQCLARAALSMHQIPRVKRRPGPEGYVIFAGDQGLCGNFNERIVDFALESIAAGGSKGPLFAIGRRGADIIARKGFAPRRVIPAPTSLEGAGAGVQDMAEMVFDAFGREGLSGVVLFHSIHEGGARAGLERSLVLPLDLKALAASVEPFFRTAPRLQLPPEDLVESFVREYFFVLFRAAALESFASENGARLAAMGAASKNVEERVELLTELRNRMRQEAVTAEVLETAAGSAAVIEGGGSAGTD